MKKISILLFIFAACLTMQAQTPITVLNGDFSSGSTLTGSSPWTITGWTISQNSGLSAAGNAALTAASSGVIGGALTCTGTNSTAASSNNLNQGALLVESDKIDISSYAGSTTAFTYAFQIKVATATTANAPWNVVTKVYDASNAEVLSAISQTKSQGNLKTTAAGTYLNASVVGTLLGAPSANVKYITIQVHLGQMLANTPTLDNFTLNAAGAAASTTLTQPVSTALSYEIGAGPSAEQSFQVAGANLGSNNITVTPGANIEISSNSGSGFATSAIILTQSGGTVNTTTLYARLIADKDLGTVGANATRQVNVAATGTTTKTIQFTGTVNGIKSSVAGGAEISYAYGAGPSAEKTLTIQGVNLGAATSVDVTPGSNMEISLGTGVAFVPTNPISLPVVTNAITSTTIYARLKAGLAAGSYTDATTKVTASVIGASFTSKEVAFTGTVNFSNGSYNVADGNELNINQNSTSATFTISPLGKVTLPDNTTLTSSSITLQSNASGTATFVDLNTTPQTVTGTVQQYLTAERNWYTSSPITAGTAAGLNRGTSVQTYSESAKGWTTLLETDALVNGKGYVSVATTGTGTLTPGTVSFNGTLNSGTVTVPVTRTEEGSSRGFNLVANPYPSYLDWSSVTADPLNANIGTTMWFRTKTTGGLYTFSTYNSDGNVAVGNSANTTISKFIPPMQAFWIRVNANIGITTYSTNITFKNSMRAHKDVSGNTFKAPKLNNQQLLRLQVSNGTYSDEAVVYFNADASNAFDKYDSQKMFENEDALKPEIFTQIGNEKLVINGLNTISYNTEIPLGLVTKQAGNFSISANELLNFESGTRVILKDKLNPAIETELTPETVYNFNAPVTAASTDRFSLIFRAPGVTTGSNNIGNVKTQVFVNATNQITIIAPEKAMYSVYNAVGQLVENGRITSNSQTSNFKLSVGVYVVKVNNQSTRVIVK